jgi:hypothetical protein
MMTVKRRMIYISMKLCPHVSLGDIYPIMYLVEFGFWIKKKWMMIVRAESGSLLYSKNFGIHETRALVWLH